MSIDTTTGMSAPPIAMTMWMPKSSATAVITASGISPPPAADSTTNRQPNHSTTASIARFSQCRPGSVSGLPPMLPLNLPNAMIEPEKRDSADQDADVRLDVMNRLGGPDNVRGMRQEVRVADEHRG